MPDDILDAAQKAIDQAATGAKSIPPTTDVLPSAPSLPVEPPPIPAVPEAPKQDEAPAATVPPTTDPSLDATKQAMMNELLGSSTVAPAVPASSGPTQHANGNFSQKKKPHTGMILAVIALLLLTVPVAVYFVAQTNNSIADLRGRASWDTTYQGCTLNSCPSGYTCHCQNGNACTYTWCEQNIEAQCRNQGREYCINGYNGDAMTCCLPGYSCGSGGEGCYQEGGGGDDDNGDDDTVQPTPTPPTTPVCQNIKVYKGGVQVAPATLLPGDVVTLAVKGNLNPTKARFRINGGAFTETTTKNASNEFTLSYTIPDGVPDFVIEGEVNTNGAWY